MNLFAIPLVTLNDPDDDDDFDTGFFFGAAVDLTPTYPTPGDVYIGIGEDLILQGDEYFDLTIPADINNDITDATMNRALSFGVRSSLLNPAETPELEIELSANLSLSLIHISEPTRPY